jgi:hypothetical protein
MAAPREIPNPINDPVPEPDKQPDPSPYPHVPFFVPPSPSVEVAEKFASRVIESKIPKDEIVTIMRCFVGAFVLYFGIFNAGSFYATNMRFTGMLATWFYSWQIGSLLETIGALTLYKYLPDLWVLIKDHIVEGSFLYAMVRGGK